MTRTTTAPTESTTALLDAADRLAERARKESWTHAEYLVACLQREVSARESHGGEARVRAARFPAIKTIEELRAQVRTGPPLSAPGLRRWPTATRPSTGCGCARRSC